MLHLPLETQQPASDSDSSELLLGSGAILRKDDEGTTTYQSCKGTSVGHTNTQHVLISVATPIMHIGVADKAMSKSVQKITQQIYANMISSDSYPESSPSAREKSSPLTPLSRSTLSVRCLHFKGLKGSVVFLVKSGIRWYILFRIGRKALYVDVLMMS